MIFAIVTSMLVVHLFLLPKTDPDERLKQLDVAYLMSFCLLVVALLAYVLHPNGWWLALAGVYAISMHLTKRAILRAEQASIDKMMANIQAEEVTKPFDRVLNPEEWEQLRDVEYPVE